MAGSVTISIVPRGNAYKDWQLCLLGQSSLIGPAGKPLADVEWQLAGGGGWQPVSGGEQLVAAGSGRADLDVLFRVAVGFDDAPGDYETILMFAVARQ